MDIDQVSREAANVRMASPEMGADSAMTKLDEVLEALREAESLLGTETTVMFLDAIPEHRLNWLRKVRALLSKNGIKPENLSGRWHT
jgi:hypothetical protein